MQLGLAWLACFAAGGLYGWSALIPALRATYQTSTADAGMVFSLAIVCSTIAFALAPRLPGGLPPLRMICIFCAVGACGLCAASVAPSFALFLPAYSLGFGSASGAIYILAVSMAAESKRPQLATAVFVAAFGMGGAVAGPVFRLLSGPGTGLAVLLYLAALLIAIAALAWPAGRRPAAAAAAAQAGAMPAAGWRPAIGLWCIFCLGAMAGLMTLGLASSIVESRGGSAVLSSTALAAIAIGNTAGRLSVGVLSPWLSCSHAISGGMLLTLAGLGIAGLAAAPAATAGALVLIALGYGLLASGIPAGTRQILGAQNFRAFFSLILSAWGVAGLASPWLAGLLFDYQGSYLPAFALAAAATAAALALNLRLSFAPLEK